MVKLEWYTQDRENYQKSILILGISFGFLIMAIIYPLPIFCIGIFAIFTIFNIYFCYWMIFKSERYIAANVYFKDIRIDRTTIMDGYRKIDNIFQDIFKSKLVDFQKVEQNAGNLGYELPEKNLFIDIMNDYYGSGSARYWFFEIIIRPVNQETEKNVKYLQKIISEMMRKEIS